LVAIETSVKRWEQRAAAARIAPDSRARRTETELARAVAERDRYLRGLPGDTDGEILLLFAREILAERDYQSAAVEPTATEQHRWKARHELEQCWAALDRYGGTAGRYAYLRRGAPITYAQTHAMLREAEQEAAWP